MQPKRAVIVLTMRPELRFALRIAGRRLDVIDATWEEAIRRSIRTAATELVIVDARDAPEMADISQHLRRSSPFVKTILIIDREPRPEWSDRADQIICDGAIFMERLLRAVSLSLAHKRGPAKGSHHNLCQYWGS